MRWLFKILNGKEHGINLVVHLSLMSLLKMPAFIFKAHDLLKQK